MSSQSPILYLIRHGEKPPKEADGEDAPGLSAQGISRAEGLAKVFDRGSPYNIGYIIAQHPKKHDKETRPYLTVKPLADALRVPFNSDIGRDDVDQVPQAIQAFKEGTGNYQGSGNVLICWEHGYLQKVAQAIGVADAPAYPGDHFDLIWKIEAPYTEIESTTSENVPGLDDKSAKPQD